MLVILLSLTNAVSITAQLLSGFQFHAPPPEPPPTTPVCPPVYTSIPDHSLCRVRNPKSNALGVSQAEKVLILAEHNKYRSQVTATIGGTVYAPTDLAKITWDENLAKIAQGWANQCPTSNDGQRQRSVPEYGDKIGQSIHVDRLYVFSWNRAIKSWYDEIPLYQYGVDPLSYLQVDERVGHVTQIVSNSTTRVGCGYSICKDSPWKNYYVCNYGPGQESVRYPFTPGTRCSACPGNCVGGLCDKACSGLLCRNGGTLDYGTCKCTCDSLFTGSECQNINCPLRDDVNCNIQYDATQCSNGGEVSHLCPYMCGLCTGDYGTYFSQHECVYHGVRQSSATCSVLGDNGADGTMCETNGGQYNCTYCDYLNVQEACPVMCGICEAQVPVYTSHQGCIHRGSRPSMERCTSLGRGGDDYSVCASYNGGIGCTQCSADAVIRNNICPVTCGVCAKP